MTINNVLTFGRQHRACHEAMHWLEEQTDAEQAWQSCERPDWLIWYARRRGVDHKTLVRIACDCARTALRFVPQGEDRPRIAIETTERWLDGRATLEEVRTARNAAYAAYAAYAAADAAADAAAAADASYAAAAAAADASYAAASYAAADAAAYAAAAAAADASYAAAADASYAAARKQANIQMCNIIRTHIPYTEVAL